MRDAREADPSDNRQEVFGILIVEDHAPTRTALAALLPAVLQRSMPQRRFCVVTAPDAETALDLIAAQAPDLVVMDISLPGMNGIDAVRRLRRTMPDLPVIIHSAKDMDIYRSMAAEVGARAFVSKQRTVQDLPASILSVLAPPSSDLRPS